jgi:hypothetical protein
VRRVWFDIKGIVDVFVVTRGVAGVPRAFTNTPCLPSTGHRRIQGIRDERSRACGKMRDLKASHRKVEALSYAENGICISFFGNVYYQKRK